MILTRRERKEGEQGGSRASGGDPDTVAALSLIDKWFPRERG